MYHIFHSCKEFQNLNAFFAVVMGLSNVAVSRLTQTWERLPSKVGFYKYYTNGSHQINLLIIICLCLAEENV